MYFAFTEEKLLQLLWPGFNFQLPVENNRMNSACFLDLPFILLPKEIRLFLSATACAENIALLICLTISYVISLHVFVGINCPESQICEFCWAMLQNYVSETNSDQGQISNKHVIFLKIYSSTKFLAHVNKLSASTVDPLNPGKEGRCAQKSKENHKNMGKRQGNLLPVAA